MTYNDMINNCVEFQVAVHLCYYDYDTDERIEGNVEELGNKEIRYMYTEDNEIYIEVEMEY